MWYVPQLSHYIITHNNAIYTYYFKIIGKTKKRGTIFLQYFAVFHHISHSAPPYGKSEKVLRHNIIWNWFLYTSDNFTVKLEEKSVN